MWDLTANACSCELVPEVGTAVRSITVALDGSLVVAANNAGTCYVWRMMRGASLTTHFEPLHKLRAHAGAPYLPWHNAVITGVHTQLPTGLLVLALSWAVILVFMIHIRVQSITSKLLLHNDAQLWT